MKHGKLEIEQVGKLAPFTNLSLFIDSRKQQSAGGRTIILDQPVLQQLAGEPLQFVKGKTLRLEYMFKGLLDLLQRSISVHLIQGKLLRLLKMVILQANGILDDVDPAARLISATNLEVRPGPQADLFAAIQIVGSIGAVHE
jgi:hypothetical protein